MNAHDLARQLESGQPPKLLHVLPPEVFAAARIPGSRNACVYEIAFLDQVRAFGFDPTTRIVVYGAGEGALDAAAAAEKLRSAGFGEVGIFEGGLAAWKAAGFSLEGTGEFPRSPVPDGVFRVDPAESVIRWTGRNLFNHHHGTVRLADGEICVHSGVLESARFTIDMASIANEDIADAGMRAMLLAHLHTADFFDVARHPTAEFIATSAEKIESATEGTPNYMLRGTFTLRGISRLLEFPIVVAAKDDGHLTGQGQLELDRTEFGSQYGSGKLFRFLGPHLVNDHIHLHVKIHAARVTD